MRHIILTLALISFLNINALADWKEAQVAISPLNPVDTSNSSMNFIGIDCADHENCFAVANDQGLYRVVYHSSDAGKNWEMVYKPDYDGKNKNLILRSMSYPSKNRCVIACDSGVVILTEDRGKNWKRVNTPIYDPSNYALFTELKSVIMLDSMNGMAASMTQMIYTKDGGNSWDTLKSPSETPMAMDLTTILSPTTFLCIARKSLNRLKVFITEDSGENWSDYDFMNIGTMKRLCFVDSLNGWAVGGYTGEAEDQFTQRIAVTRDGGKTWKMQFNETLYPFARLEDVSFHDKDNGIAVSTTGGILRTSDGGENWLSSNSDVILKDTAAHNYVAYQHVTEPVIANFEGKIFYYSIFDDVREIFSGNNFNIYPNPALSGSQINITVAIDNYSDIEISISDIFGRIMNSKTYPGLSIGSHKFVYEPSVQMPSGSYFIRLKHNSGVVSKKITIVK
ncbi:MAG: T9SS type A sorting domain-containing protein [Candidatus Kapabacteria bacterium]|jgi:photosystem II stability/assembly factor-like uncharacterized protein|nr:T9SS type A sorting domain-containing protein [Candidatus Kapabacteria bacterium]